MEQDQGIPASLNSPPRRRFLLWIVGVLVVCAVALASVAAAGRNRYAFLERFHPKHVIVNYGLVFRGTSSRGTAPPNLTMFVFADEDGPKVLEAMKAELTPARGFKSEDYMATLKKAAGGPLPTNIAFQEEWLFEKGRTELVLFERGRNAAFADNFYRGLPTPTNVGVNPKTCVVLLRRNLSWFERQMMGVRAFMHLE